LLAEASRTRDRAASELRDLGLDPEMQLRRIAEALVKISEIRSAISDIRPDLTPDYVRRA
jgi:hypothetical protein